MTIVVLGGVKGSGKDTVGDLMEAANVGGFYMKYSFATPLKKMAAIAFPQLTHEQLWGSSSKREEFIDVEMRGLDPRNGTPMANIRVSEKEKWWRASDGTHYPRWLNARIILQILGTEWGRRLNDNIWVDAGLSYCERGGDNWVITDQRFPNEVVVARARGAVTVRLLRGFYEAQDRFEKAGVLRNGVIQEDALSEMSGQDFHASELMMFTIPDYHYDYVLDNTVELAQLPRVVDALCAEVRHPAASWLRFKNFTEEMRERGGRLPTLQPVRIGL